MKLGPFCQTSSQGSQTACSHVSKGAGSTTCTWVPRGGIPQLGYVCKLNVGVPRNSPDSKQLISKRVCAGKYKKHKLKSQKGHNQKKVPLKASRMLKPQCVPHFWEEMLSIIQKVWGTRISRMNRPPVQ